MSELSGNLQDFPLPDVLRLLGKSRKGGVLHLYGDDARGRIYLDDGRITYATTRAGDDFADPDAPERRSGDRRRVELSGIKDRDPQHFQDHLKSQIVEVLVRLGRESSGSFVFQNGVTPSEPVKEPFLVDELLTDAEAELKEWTRIEGIIGSTATPMTMIETLPADATITIDGMAWNALAVMASSATARRVADQLGQFEIVAARAIARLVEQGLIEPALDAPPETEEAEPEPPEDVEFSEDETKQVLSALTSGTIDPPATDAEEEASEPIGLDLPSRSGEASPDDEADDGWGGLEDEPPTDPEPEPDESEFDGQPPASELARRWRNLRSTTTP